MEQGPARDRGRVALACLATLALLAHLALRLSEPMVRSWAEVPLWVALAFGGSPLLWGLGGKLLRREFGSDLLAGISIVASALLDEPLAGTLVVLMLSGGEALEEYAVRRASSVLEVLAGRMPSVAHLKRGLSVVDVALEEIQLGDTLEIFPHEICPVDGVVLAGHGRMDESYLTGEPFLISKTPGAEVYSGSLNGDTALTVAVGARPVDSRHARILEVMRATETRRPRLRRLGDRLGAWYTPLALLVALVAWVGSGDPMRALAVLVIATPCPLLIAIPVAILGTISVCAGRGIVVRDPAILEQVDTCQTMILDKTGTLTYGRPELTEETLFSDHEADTVLRLAASLERYSKHPLASALVGRAQARGLEPGQAESIQEPPGQGLRGIVEGREVQITSRARLPQEGLGLEGLPPQEGLGLEGLPPRACLGLEGLPPRAGLGLEGLPPRAGLECLVLVDGALAALYRFRDEPRGESRGFVAHLAERHGIDRVMIVSGDRLAEVEHLAGLVGIEEVHAGKSPEEKVEIVRLETLRARTLFVGDGVNDAPALLAATVGLAFGQNSEVTAEAAGAVIMESDLLRVDELLHLGRRMRRIALQSAVGGMALSIAGMGLAAAGHLSPVAGAVGQEVIDLAAVLNALRAAFPPRTLSDVPVAHPGGPPSC